MQSVVENTNIPAFLGKLWKMVDDPVTDHLIAWSSAGNSFIIQSQAQFWYELLPLYYKHNNMSSFVRQLNMYGFHKISTVENGSMDADKDEIQFYHPYFQKDHPEKLVNIKRKVTTTKGHDAQGGLRNEDLTKVLTEVKQLRGRQSSVDSQLSAMKQENAVLWRELALLRQKHIKQQQIVNKLIQFLITLVQPATSARMGVGVKRRMPLMLHESAKRVKNRKTTRPSSDAGPTIFELENEVDISPEQILEDDVEEELPLINSPIASTPSSSETSNVMDSSIINHNIPNDVTNQDTTDINFLWDKPEFIDIDDPSEDFSSQEENFINSLSSNVELTTEPTEKVFINPSSRNTLISNLLNSGSQNINALGGKNGKKQYVPKQVNNTRPQLSMQVATKNSQGKLNSGFSKGKLDQHVENAQSEIDQLKDILSGCSSLDASSLLSLFAGSDPDYGIRGTLQNKENTTEEANDPLVSGNELTSTNLLDFNNLLNDSLSNDGNLDADADLLNPSDIPLDNTLENTSLDTPLMVKNEPVFPNST